MKLGYICPFNDTLAIEVELNKIKIKFFEHQEEFLKILHKILVYYQCLKVIQSKTDWVLVILYFKLKTSLSFWKLLSLAELHLLQIMINFEMSL